MSTHEQADGQVSPQADQALYVYGFTRAGAVGPLSVPGVSGADDVETFDLGEIAALFSPISMQEFLGPEGAENTQNLEWVAPRAIRHQQVLEEVMRVSPVLPVTFGAIFSSPRALSEAFKSHRGRIAQFLDDIADKEEWAVKVYANPAQLKEYLGAAPEFRQRLQQLPEAPGARYFHEKRLQRELEERSRHEGKRLAEQIRQELTPLAIAVKPLRLSSREVTCRTDDMVLNDAFLAQAGQVERFLDQVHRLADQYQQQGLAVEATGPWPPYSFCPSLEERP